MTDAVTAREIQVQVFLATVTYQDGGPSCGEAQAFSQVFGSRPAADAWVIGELRATLASNEYDTDDLEDAEVQEHYLDCCEDDECIPSASWEVTAQMVGVTLP